MTTGDPLRIRKAVAKLTIVTFSIAAFLGVWALVGGGGAGESEARVLLTTLLIGVVSIAVLCYLATAGTPYEAVGVSGGVAVLAPLGAGLMLIWGLWDLGAPDEVGQTFGVGAVVAATLAQACLLLILSDGEGAGVRMLLALTLVVAGLFALMVSLVVLGIHVGDVEVRIIGVVAILDVLGTVVVAALSKLGPDEERGFQVTLPGRFRLELDGHAADIGRSRSEVVSRAVEEYLTSQGQKGHTR